MRTLIILFSCLFSLNLSGQTTAELEKAFHKGNTAFANQEFEKAADIYEQIIAKGHLSFELHYNLGNTYFRLNNIPKAILHYERALKIEPNHADAKYNLELANQRTIDQISNISTFVLVRWWKSWQGLLSSNLWSIFTILASFLGFASLSLWQLSKRQALRKRNFIIGVTCSSIALVFGFTAAAKFQTENSDNAILFAKEYPLKSGADDSSPDILLLHEGTKVEILDKIGLWSKVCLPNGEQGWLPSDSLVKI